MNALVGVEICANITRLCSVRMYSEISIVSNKLYHMEFDTSIRNCKQDALSVHRAKRMCSHNKAHAHTPGK